MVRDLNHAGIAVEPITLILILNFIISIVLSDCLCISSNSSIVLLGSIGALGMIILSISITNHRSPYTATPGKLFIRISYPNLSPHNMLLE
jgi:hypothetical protein